MPADLEQLHDSLHYLHVEELRQVNEDLYLPVNGKKGDLIYRIITFLKTGKVARLKPIPASSKARKGTVYTLAPHTKMLYGAYKNDLKTRLFMKKLVGEHFHFTAAGIDWLNEQWHAGNPPTYQEFADFWRADYERKKNNKPTPKREWAYINFTQRYIVKKPSTTHREITQAWNAERERQVAITRNILHKIQK